MENTPEDKNFTEQFNKNIYNYNLRKAKIFIIVFSVVFIFILAIVFFR